MDEDIAGRAVAHHESIALGAIEPFDDRCLQRAIARHLKDRARRCRSTRRLATHRRRLPLPQIDHAHDLPPLGAAGAFASDDCAFGGDLMPPVPQATDVQQHVFQLGQVRLIGHDEAIALARIEPFHRAGDQNDVRRFNLIVVRQLTNPRLQSAQRL
ncbi:hypothetical protein D3C72_1533800 [compost metagenome]